MGKQVQFIPFGDSTHPYAFDEDMRCPERYEKSIEEMDLGELNKLLDELYEALATWDDFIYDDMNALKDGRTKDTSYLKSDRQQRQQCLVELRAVKKQIKMMMKTDEGEKIAA